MAKEDFCFTYYDGDAARDKAHMNRLERGAYDDLISAQRKRGHLSLDDIKKVLSSDFEKCWPSMEWVLIKDEAGKFFIEWVDKSIEKMRRQSEKQKENISKRWKKDENNTEPIPNEYHGIEVVIPLENENEDGNEYGIEGKGGTGEKPRLWTEIKQDFFNSEGWQVVFCTEKDVGRQDLIAKMREFITDLDLKEDFKDLRELKNHFTNWFNKQKKSNGSSSKQSISSQKSDAASRFLKKGMDEYAATVRPEFNST